MEKPSISHLSARTRYCIRNAVHLAVRYWPSAHLGDTSPRQDIRSAFYRIRRGVERGETIQTATGRVESDAYAHADM